MAGRRIHIVMDEELVKRIDAALPVGVSRGEFVRGAVERALEGPVERTRSVAGPPDGEPAPAEQSAKLRKGPGDEWAAEVVERHLPLSRSELFRRATQK